MSSTVYTVWCGSIISSECIPMSILAPTFLFHLGSSPWHARLGGMWPNRFGLGALHSRWVWNKWNIILRWRASSGRWFWLNGSALHSWLSKLRERYDHYQMRNLCCDRLILCMYLTLIFWIWYNKMYYSIILFCHKILLSICYHIKLLLFFSVIML